VNISNRDLLEQVHIDYIRTGAEIIITNTFATTRLILEPAGLAAGIEDIYRSACEAALSAREKASPGSGDVLVAGSLSHMVPMTAEGAEIPEPYAGIGREAFSEALREAAELLRQGGCDFIMLEMMYHPDRFSLALEAALSTGLPVWAGFSARRGSGGETLCYYEHQDIPFERVVEKLPETGVDAAGIMHTNVDVTGPALDILRRYFRGPRYAYPDSGYLKMPNWQFEDIIDPADLRTYAEKWIAGGASAVGGCCGLSVEHIEAIASLKR
jgi:homocysteine S-methyltransferase